MKTEKNNIAKPILAQLRDLLVGETVAYPVDRLSTVRTMCSSYGLQWNKKFQTRVSRDTGTIVVTRLN
jgi:hypothetical protein